MLKRESKVAIIRIRQTRVSTLPRNFHETLELCCFVNNSGILFIKPTHVISRGLRAILQQLWKKKQEDFNNAKYMVM